MAQFLLRRDTRRYDPCSTNLTANRLDGGRADILDNRGLAASILGRLLRLSMTVGTRDLSCRPQEKRKAGAVTELGRVAEGGSILQPSSLARPYQLSRFSEFSVGLDKTKGPSASASLVGLS